MTPEEELEEKLATVAEFMARMDYATLREFRGTCAKLHAGTKECEMVLEVIDGQLALREINAADID